MAGLKKYYDKTFEKGEYADDDIYEVMRELNHISSKPLNEKGETDEWSYNTILHNKIKIVLYIEM